MSFWKPRGLQTKAKQPPLSCDAVRWCGTDSDVNWNKFRKKLLKLALFSLKTTFLMLITKNKLLWKRQTVLFSWIIKWNLLRNFLKRVFQKTHIFGEIESAWMRLHEPIVVCPSDECSPRFEKHKIWARTRIYIIQIDINYQCVAIVLSRQSWSCLVLLLFSPPDSREGELKFL